MAISAPATMAIAAMTVPIPEKLSLSRGIKPVRISQTANSSIPKLLFIGTPFALLSLSGLALALVRLVAGARSAHAAVVLGLVGKAAALVALIRLARAVGLLRGARGQRHRREQR